MKLFAQKGKSIDYITLGVVMLLCVFGLIMLTSAGSAIGFQKFGDSYFFVKRQIVSFVIGFTFLVVMMNIDYHKLKRLALPGLIVSIILLLLVFIPGIGATLLGGSRWIGFGGIVFQPSELVKLTFFLYLAAWLDSRKDVARTGNQHLFSFLILLSIVAGLIIMQPDMGTMSVIAIVSGVIFFSSGASVKHILWLLGGGISFFFILIKLAPYRADRFTAFLNPDLDPRGIGYHIQQSLIAIGSGGLLGVGLGKSRQKFTYLPEAAGDSIFAVVAEELGFIFSALLVVLFLVLFLRGLRIAQTAPDGFGKLLATGIIAWITLQAFMNIAALSSLMPLTGIPLPFISYGGSSMMITLAGVGVLLNISKFSKR